MMGKKGFTLLEILIVVIIVMVLGTIAIGGYQQVLENARARVCTTNLKALGTAVELWALENDFLPATLGQLKQEHLEKGYAYAIGEKDWITKFSYAMVTFDRSHSAYAQPTEEENGPFLSPDNLRRFGASPDLFVCPSDPSPPPEGATYGTGGISYGINSQLNASWNDLNGDGKVSWSEVPDSAIIVADYDSTTFDGYSNMSRHRRLPPWIGNIIYPGTNGYALMVTKNKEIRTEHSYEGDPGGIDVTHGGSGGSAEPDPPMDPMPPEQTLPILD